jgi:hypothetical protein
MIHVAEKRGPMNLVRLLLCLNGASPIELLHDSPVTQYQFAASELRRQTHYQRAKHVAAARCVLVWGEVTASGIDVDAIEFRGDGIRVVRNKFSLNRFQNAGRFRVEVLDCKPSFLSFELKCVAHHPIVPGLFAIAEGCRLAMSE